MRILKSYSNKNKITFHLQSFANEDQLTVHKKKHDMMLNLNNNSKSAGFVGKISPQFNSCTYMCCNKGKRLIDM